MTSDLPFDDPHPENARAEILPLLRDRWSTRLFARSMNSSTTSSPACSRPRGNTSLQAREVVPRTRKELSQLVFAERWGNPYGLT